MKDDSGQGQSLYSSHGNSEGHGSIIDVRTQKSYEVVRENSKRSTEEDELRSLSTTPRMSHEDYGRVVSPPHTPFDEMIDTGRTDRTDRTDLRMSDIDDSFRDIMFDAEAVRRDVANQQSQRKRLENRLKEVEEEKKELNMKMAAMRVKLGVANSSSNVCKTECEKLRKDLQETQIKKARLEERIKSCNKEIDRLSDPSNPDSNVNLKKIVVNDRKEIRRLRSELDAIKSERSSVQEEILNRDTKIRKLHTDINDVRDTLDTCQTDFDVAKISALSEQKKREEIEEKHEELLKEKNKFDNSMADLQSQLDKTLSETSEIQQQTEKSKEREDELITKIALVEKKLKDVMTEIEQQKNQNMPVRTASSIKYHQYRMSRSVVVSDTTPHVIITSNPKGSIAASGYLGKSVAVRKTSTSLPSKTDMLKATPRGRASLPAKR